MPWTPTPTELIRHTREEIARPSYTGVESSLKSLLARFIALVALPEDEDHELPKGVKVYTTADGPMHIRAADADLLGLKHHRTQAGGYIAGRTKAEVIARLDTLGYPSFRTSHLRLASGRDMDRLIDVGIIRDDGALVLTGDHQTENIVVVNTDEIGDRYARLVARLYYPPRTEKVFERINY